MKNILFVIIIFLSIYPVTSAQDYDYDKWMEEQQRLISEGYGTIFDTFAYQNGDYVVLEDGSIALDTRRTTDEEQKEIENSWYDNRSTASRISPTSEIGLFIDNTTFYEYLFRSRMGSLIRELKFEEGDPDGNITNVSRWILPGSSMISCNFNRYGKIHSIVIKLSGSFTKDQDVLTFDDVLTLVLQATGLPYDWEDIYSAVKSVDEKNAWNGWLYGITSRLDPFSVSVIFNIMSSYDFNEDDPYSVMKLFDGPCDSNYVGACVPVVDYDLNCSDIGLRNFFVVGSDKHGFDGDGNGVCCEPYPIV